jgi:hypothetical protein
MPPLRKEVSPKGEIFQLSSRTVKPSLFWDAHSQIRKRALWEYRSGRISVLSSGIKAEKEGPDSFAAFLPPELLLGVHPSSLLLD